MRLLCKGQQVTAVSNSHFAILLYFYQTVNCESNISKLLMQLQIYGNVIRIHKGSVCVFEREIYFILFYFLQYATMILNSEIDL